MYDSIEAFWAKVDVQDETQCWEWKSYTDKKGYGMFWDGIKLRRATRFCWEIIYGEIQNNLYVCHTCDNPKCVNPAHLWLGTNSQNMIDAIRKKRIRRDREFSRSRKLSEIQVAEIRDKFENGVNRKTLRTIYNVSLTTISNIINRKTWK